MKHLRPMKRVAGAAVLALGLAVGGCSVPQETDTLQSRGEGTVGTQEAADLEIERADTRMELIALRDRIDARIGDVDDHMKMMDIPAERRNELQEYRGQLEENRERVDKELQNVESADTNTWANIKSSASNTAEDVDDWFTRQADKVEAWFEEEEAEEDTYDLDADLEMERAETRAELNELGDRIDAQMNQVDNQLQMSTVDETRRNELREYRTELEQNRERVDKELDGIRTAETRTWANIRQGADKTVEEIGDWFSRQGERIEGWFDEDE